VTYLFDGALSHRDSVGTVIDIAPGAVNWMTAGRGIVHSGRTPPAARATGHRLHGIQSWVALPDAHAKDVPGFAHHPAASLPSIMFGGAKRTLIAGTAFGATSPVAALSPMFYIDIEADPGASVALPAEHEERAIYVVGGTIDLNGVRYAAGQMIVLASGGEVEWTALESTRAMLLGGASLGRRHIEWSFVSSSQDRIEQAKADWIADRFPQVPGETEFIPLPEPARVAEGGPTS
jgi:redox-sensitive bicupin YhaK (pirin superfamily)